MPILYIIKGVSSNKQGEIGLNGNKIEQKTAKIAVEDISYLAAGERVAVLRPVLDKIAITYQIPEPDLAGAVIESLLQEAEAKQNFKSAPQFKSGAMKYAASTKLIMPFSGAETLVQAGPKKSGVKHGLRLEFNPSRLGKSGILFLKERLESLVANGLSYEKIISQGTVTRLDVAVDLVGIGLHDLDVSYSGTGKCHWYYSSEKKAQTGYFGVGGYVKDKSAPYIIYNKRKELAEKSKVIDSLHYNGLSHTRIEYRGKPMKSFLALENWKNPFTSISLAFPQPPEGVPPHLWQFFIDSCHRRGHQATLAMVPEGERALFTKGLWGAHQAFWNPHKIWMGWENALVDSGLLLNH